MNGITTGPGIFTTTLSVADYSPPAAPVFRPVQKQVFA